MRAELSCEPICTLEANARTVKVVFVFAVTNADGQPIELSWEESQPQPNGKRYGGTVRCLVPTLDDPVTFEVAIPLTLFMASSRIDLKLRTMKPLRSLGYGRGIPQIEPDDVVGTAKFVLQSWSDLA